MGEGKLKVEDKLVPKGPDVVRHLRLLEAGQSPEWIIEETQKMKGIRRVRRAINPNTILLVGYTLGSWKKLV
ncbi:hypothetical protein HGRIS_001057 [Hohenbuehelia grisea]|uniref:Uncharacterized protein n=1 Tax=Hohenbuehelia grisea TaxID=104357 RepID=A0ABR3JN52_9AGAR